MFVIHSISFFSKSLHITIQSPMKRSSIYLMLLLLAMAVTLTLWVLFNQNWLFQLKYQPVPTQHPVFNQTLLQQAAIDISEPRLKQEIDNLLEDNISQWQISFLWGGKYPHDVSLRLGSPEFYRLWLSFRTHLGDWSRKRRFNPDVLSDLANGIKPLIDERNGIVKGSRRLYKSCAVVGNSGILLNSDYGKKIDGHETVIRLNNAWTRGFERRVGWKTGISFVNSNVLHSCARRRGCFCHPYGESVPIVMYLCQPAHFFDYLTCNSSHKAPLIVTDPGFDVLCARIMKYYSLRRFVETTGKDVGEWGPASDEDFHYSSGMQAVMLALGMCEKVSVFGFGKSSLARHHYHSTQKSELSLHDYEAEYDFYRDLVERPWAIPFVSDKFKFPSVRMYH